MTTTEAKAVMTAATDRINQVYKTLSTAIVQANTPTQMAAAFNSVDSLFQQYLDTLESHSWPETASSDVQQAVADLKVEFSDLKALGRDPGSQSLTNTFVQESGVAHAQLDKARHDLGLPSLPPL